MKFLRHRRFLVLLFFLTGNGLLNAQTQCWEYAAKENKEKFQYTLTEVYTKDTSIDVKGLDKKAIVIAINNVKEEKPHTLDALLKKNLISKRLTIICHSGEGYPQYSKKNGGVVFSNAMADLATKGYALITSPEDLKIFDDTALQMELSITNLCGKTDHFLINYKPGNTNWHAVEATYSNTTNDGCDNDMKVEYFTIGGSGVTVTGGNIVFSDNASFSFEGRTNITNTVVTNTFFRFIGKDGKGNADSFDVEVTPDLNTGKFLSAVKIGKYDKEFVLGEVNCTVTNFCGGKKTLKGGYDNKNTKTTFAILFNGNKRPAKYGQCMVFAGKVKDSSTIYRFPDLVVRNEVYKDPKSGNVIFSSVIAPDPDKQNRTEEFNQMVAWNTVRPVMRVRYQDKSTSITRNLDPVLNAASGNYEFKIQFAIENGTPQWGLVALDMFMENECGDTFRLSTENKSGADVGGNGNFHVWTEVWNVKQRFTDACASDIDFKKPEVTASRVNGLYTLEFSLELAANSDLPGKVIMNVALKNCKGETVYIDVALKYNAKTNTVSGALGYYDEKNCVWKCEDISLKVLNECGKEVKKDSFPKLIQKMKDKIAKGDV